MFTENDLALSTMVHRSRRPRRYVSAEHAVDQYLTMKHSMGGSKALDYEKISLRVQTQPAPVNPALDDVDDVLLLERSFKSVSESLKASSWLIWCTVRVKKVSMRRVPGHSKSKVARTVEKVDGLVEHELVGRGMMVRNAVRLEAQRMMA